MFFVKGIILGKFGKVISIIPTNSTTKISAQTIRRATGGNFLSMGAGNSAGSSKKVLLNPNERKTPVAICFVLFLFLRNPKKEANRCFGLLFWLKLALLLLNFKYI